MADNALVPDLEETHGAYANDEYVDSHDYNNSSKNHDTDDGCGIWFLDSRIWVMSSGLAWK